ncbi:MAG: hypothetical protein ACAI44_33745 [Candidatus Sericytochromatia bacterium]
MAEAEDFSGSGPLAEALMREGFAAGLSACLAQKLQALNMPERTLFVARLHQLAASRNLADRAGFRHLANSFALPYGLQQIHPGACVPACCEFLLLTRTPATYAGMYCDWLGPGRTRLPDGSEVLQAAADARPETRMPAVFQASLLARFARLSPAKGLAQDFLTRGKIWSEATHLLEAVFPGQLQYLALARTFADAGAELNRLLNQGKQLLLFRQDHACVLTAVNPDRRGNLYYQYFDPATVNRESTGLPGPAEMPLAALRQDLTNLILIA